MMSFDLSRVGPWTARALGVVCAAVLIVAGLFAIVTVGLGAASGRDVAWVVRGHGLWPEDVVISAAVALVFGAACAGGGAISLWMALRPDAKAAQQRAKQIEAQQRQLNEQLRQTAAQEERNRLARDLHDTIKQQLFSINVAAATAQSLRERDPDGAAQHLQEVRSLSQSAMVEMKALLTQLRPQPLATVGLVGAIEEQLDALRFRSEVRVAFEHDELPDESRLPLGAQDAIFRVVQEALANVARHARAKQVRVGIARQSAHHNDALCITIADDGQGFDAANMHAGMGMSNMRARLAELGGTLDVASAAGRGTSITLNVPLLRPNALREAQQRAKEERVHQAYLASTLPSFGVAVLFAFGLITALFSSNASSNTSLLAVILAVGAVFVLPVFFAAFSYRRRATAGDDPTGIWRLLLRSYDIGQIAFLMLFAAYLLLSFTQIALAVLVAVAGAFLMVVSWRHQHRLDSRIDEWATVRSLRTRLNEQLVFMVFGAAFIALVYLGLFGDIRQATLFHDRLDEGWFRSFLVIGYPAILSCSIPTALTLWHQMRLLKARGGEQIDDAPRLVASRELRGQRAGATLYTLGYVAACAAIAPALLNRSTAGVVAMIAVAVTMMMLKMRVETRLTQQVREWTTLTRQNSAFGLYGFFLVLVALSMASGLIGGLVVGAGSNASAGIRAVGDTPLVVMMSVTTMMFGAPVWLALMTVITRKRLRLLKQTEVHA